MTESLLQQLVGSAGPSAVPALALLSKIMGNIVDNPSEPKFRRLKMDSAKLQQELLRHAGALEVLESVGFVKAADGTYELPAGAEAKLAAARPTVQHQIEKLQHPLVDATSHVVADYRAAVEGGAHGAGHAELQAILGAPGGRESLDVLEKVITNIRRHPESDKYRCVNLAKAAGQKVLPAEPLMVVAGFQRGQLPGGEACLQLVRADVDVLERVWAMIWWATRPPWTASSLGAFSGPAASALAAMLGAAVGDALGAPLGGSGPFEVTAAEVDKVMEMCGGGIWGVAPGQVSANTELAICLAQSLAEAPEPLGDSLLDDLAVRYGKWGKSLPFHSEMGCSRAFSRPLPASEMATRAKEMNGKSTGSGALVRCVPLAAWGVVRDDVITAAALAHEDATLSHPNPVLGHASAAAVVLVAQLAKTGGDRAAAIEAMQRWAEEERSHIVARSAVDGGDGRGWQHLSRGAQERVSERSGEQPDWAPPGEALAAIDELVGWLKRGLACDGELTFSSSTAGALLHHEVGSAEIPLVHALRHLKSGSSFETAMRATVAGGGDSSSTAAVVGAILGAAVGLEGIPERWLRAILTCDTSLGQARPPEYHPSCIPDLLNAFGKRPAASQQCN